MARLYRFPLAAGSLRCRRKVTDAFDWALAAARVRRHNDANCRNRASGVCVSMLDWLRQHGPVLNPPPAAA
jgi:hypothetical protein